MMMTLLELVMITMMTIKGLVMKTMLEMTMMTSEGLPSLSLRLKA